MSFSRHSSIVCGRLVELEVAEDDREVAGVVLDRRDVVDRLAQQPVLRVRQRLERAALDIDQVWDFKWVLEGVKSSSGWRGSVRSGQLGDSSEWSKDGRIRRERFGQQRAQRRATHKDTTARSRYRSGKRATPSSTPI